VGVVCRWCKAAVPPEIHLCPCIYRQSGNPLPTLPLVRGRIKSAPAPDEQSEHA